MKEILLQAMNNCAMRYAKGMSRFKFQWGERLTEEQKIAELSEELEKTGYVLLKRVSIKVDDDLAVFNDNSRGE